MQLNHPVLIYESIDDYECNKDAKTTIGFITSLKRVKRICNVDLGIYYDHLEDLSALRNTIQHYKFSISESQCQKIIVQSFLVIEHILIFVLKREFSEFEDVLSPSNLELLRNDEAAYWKRKENVLKEIERLKLEYFTVGYTAFTPERKAKRIKVPCPTCGELLLIVTTEGKIKCQLCRKEYSSHSELHDHDKNCIISDYMKREIGKRKHVIPYTFMDAQSATMNH